MFSAPEGPSPSAVRSPLRVVHAPQGPEETQAGGRRRWEPGLLRGQPGSEDCGPSGRRERSGGRFFLHPQRRKAVLGFDPLTLIATSKPQNQKVIVSF